MSNEIRCTLSPIHIYTDMSQPGGRAIPVGFVAELTTPEFRIMGLVGRETLDSDEFNALDGLLRRQASALWEFLASEFELACAIEPGKGLDYLAARHSFSLSFEPPKEIKPPKLLIDATRGDSGKRSRSSPARRRRISASRSSSVRSS
jgi:hypothetical protein